LNTAVAVPFNGGAQSGLVVGVGAGVTFIRASLGGVSGSSPVTVTVATLVSIAVTPDNPSLNKGQRLQFKAMGIYSNNSTQDITAFALWSSSDAAVATVLTGGLAAPVAPGATTIQASLGGASGSTSLNVTSFGGVLTYHNDSARTGQDLNEMELTPSNVNVNSFGKLFSIPVDGEVHAQPLYVPDVSIPGEGVHNVVYVATENDTVYAFDADTPSGALWQTSSLGPGETAVPNSDIPAPGCYDVNPIIGITSTPVIDPTTQTIYVVAKSKLVSGSSTIYYQRLHALDISTGQERPGSPVEISATSAGTQVTFDPLLQLNRSGLALDNGVVYIGFGSHCDVGSYHGWLFAYDATQLKQVAVFNTTPGASEGGGIWQAGGAPPFDAAGNVYVMTGNGRFGAHSGGPDYGDSFLKLSLSGNALSVGDYFTPFNQGVLDSTDYDLGSSGPLLLPDSVGSAAHPHLMLGAGKQGMIYLLDRDNMGKFCGDCTSSDTQIVQEELSLTGSYGNFGNPVYWEGIVYFGATSDYLRAFSISDGVLSTNPISTSSTLFGFPGASQSISANGSTNGIVWALDTSHFGTPGPTILHAYLATNLADELYNSAQAPGGRDAAGNAVQFSVPTIANGKVYVGTQGELDVYGLLP
jgi:hypothetical protein